MQKQSEQQQIQCNELLLQVFTDLNRFLGVDVGLATVSRSLCNLNRCHDSTRPSRPQWSQADEQDNHTPAEFGAFRETLLSRLRSVSRSKGDAEKRIKEQETAMEQRMGYVQSPQALHMWRNGRRLMCRSLKRQLESKWRALDAFESSVKKLESTRAQWRSKYAEQSGELQAAKVCAFRSSSDVSPSPACPLTSLKPDVQPLYRFWPLTFAEPYQRAEPAPLCSTIRHDCLVQLSHPIPHRPG